VPKKSPEADFSRQSRKLATNSTIPESCVSPYQNFPKYCWSYLTGLTISRTLHMILSQQMLNFDPPGLEPINPWGIHWYKIESAYLNAPLSSKIQFPFLFLKKIPTQLQPTF
jgi:hypothetical protein